MYQYPNQQQQPIGNMGVLPFPVDQLIMPFGNYHPGNPPVIPRYIGPDYLMQLVGPIAGAAAQEIETLAQQNHLRTFMFNLYSQNNFNNQAFVEMVTFIVDFVGMRLQANYNNIPNGMQDLYAFGISVVPEIVTWFCSYQVQAFPPLGQLCDQVMMNAAIVTINNFMQARNEVANYRGRTSPQGQMGGGGMAVTRFNQPPMGGGMSSGYSSNIRSSGGPIGGVGAGATGIFNNSNQQTLGRSMGGAATPRFDKPVQQNQNIVTEPVRMDTVQEEVTNQNLITVNAPSTKYKWSPQSEMRYFPAFNPLTHEAKYVYDIEKGKVVGIELTTLSEPIMDYERHRIVTSFGPLPKDIDLRNTQEKMRLIRTGIDQLNEASNLMREAESSDAINKDPDIVTYIKPEVLAETSLQVAWLEMAVERLQKEHVPDVYRAYARIAEPLVSNSDESDMVAYYASSKSFIELREKLDNTVNEVSPELWNIANRKMTKLVNRLLKQNLSIPTLSIDSFVHDIQDLMNVLLDKHGQLIYDALLKNQREYINAMFQPMYPEVAEEMSNQFFSEKQFAEGNQPKITYVCSTYSLTYLNCTAHELNLELEPTVSSAVTESFLPVMYKLLHGLFNDSHASFSLFNRHLIRTNDGHVMEATKGAVGDDVYLLTLIV